MSLLRWGIEYGGGGLDCVSSELAPQRTIHGPVANFEQDHSKSDCCPRRQNRNNYGCTYSPTVCAASSERDLAQPQILDRDTQKTTGLEKKAKKFSRICSVRPSQLKTLARCLERRVFKHSTWFMKRQQSDRQDNPKDQTQPKRRRRKPRWRRKLVAAEVLTSRERRTWKRHDKWDARRKSSPAFAFLSDVCWLRNSRNPSRATKDCLQSRGITINAESSF